jgi:hypothetical protein
MECNIKNGARRKYVVKMWTGLDLSRISFRLRDCITVKHFLNI